MLASDVNMSYCDTVTKCVEAMDKIEADPRNYSGGAKAWNSGSHTPLKAGAERKMKSLYKKMCKFDLDDE